jgi:hypothetical protein
MRMLAAAIITAAATVALALLAYVQIRAGGEQTAAALEMAHQTREAAERQWQPRVFAHPWFWAIPGERDQIPAGAVVDGTLRAAYYVVNQGSGPAFNIEHGIEIAGSRQTVGVILNMATGQEIPPVFNLEVPTGVAPLVVQVPEPEFNGEALAYWAQFENLLGERFEVVSYHDANRQAEFRRLP